MRQVPVPICMRMCGPGGETTLESVCRAFGLIGLDMAPATRLQAPCLGQAGQAGAIPYDPIAFRHKYKCIAKRIYLPALIAAAPRRTTMTCSHHAALPTGSAPALPRSG